MTTVNAAGSGSLLSIYENEQSNQLGKNDFLKILAAELQNQNPMEPVNDKEFISQLAQFSVLEQINNVSDGLENLHESLSSYFEKSTLLYGSLVVMQAAGLMGKTVFAEFEGETVSGKVNSVKIKNGVPFAVVNEVEIPVNSITKIYEEATGSDTTDDQQG